MRTRSNKKPSPRAIALNEELLALRRAERTGRHQLIVRLREMADGIFAELGYASIVEYGVRALKLSARVTKDMLELGRRLLELPRIDAAMAAGELDWTKARDMQRVATRETDEAWAKYGKTANSRQVDRAVRAARHGDGLPPDDGEAIPAPRQRRRVLGFEGVDAELIDKLVAAFRADAGASALTAEDAIVALVRQELARREGAPPREEQPVAGEASRTPLAPCAPSAEASPDAQVSEAAPSKSPSAGELPETPPSPTRGRGSRPFAPPTRRAVLPRGGSRGATAGGRRGPWVHLQDLLARAFSGDRAPREGDIGEVRGTGSVATVTARLWTPRVTTGVDA